MLPKSEIKYIQSLSLKKFRQEHQSFVAEGDKIVHELMKRRPEWLQWLYATEQWWHQCDPALRQLVGERITFIEAFELEKISNLRTPQEVMATILLPLDHTIDIKAEDLILALDGIQDPGNMGTIIRTAHWFGIDKILCSPDSADVYAPKVVQASMGSVFMVEVEYTSLPERLAAAGVPVYGALLNGEPVERIGKGTKGIIVIGNEGNGIRPEVIPTITHPVTIPGAGDAESLNAAIATGILLYSFTQGAKHP